MTDILTKLDGAWNEDHKTNLMHYCDLAAQEIRKLRAGILWCCHVRGPDDVHPAPDYDTALKWSDFINDRFGPHTRKSENDPIIRAAPAIWPGSAKEHEANVDVAIAEFASRGPLPSTERQP